MAEEQQEPRIRLELNCVTQGNQPGACVSPAVGAILLLLLLAAIVIRSFFLLHESREDEKKEKKTREITIK